MTYTDSNIEFQPHPQTFRFLNRTGFVYGQLTVLGYLGNEGKKKSFWLCQCTCGGQLKVPSNNLVSGNTTSCGCQSSRHKIGDLNLTHGLSSTPEFSVWVDMRNRCNNPNNTSFQDYGERGIRVDSRWNDFTVFLQDMGDRPSSKHTIERVDNDGNYCPENCIWTIDRVIQNNNKRSTIRLTFQNKTQPLSDWCKELHINARLVRGRLRKGWDVKSALTSPLRINQFC